jgi:hypothetical protein
LRLQQLFLVHDPQGVSDVVIVADYTSAFSHDRKAAPDDHHSQGAPTTDDYHHCTCSCTCTDHHSPAHDDNGPAPSGAISADHFSSVIGHPIDRRR